MNNLDKDFDKKFPGGLNTHHPFAIGQMAVTTEVKTFIRQREKELLARVRGIKMLEAHTDCKSCYISGQADFRSAVLKELEKEGK